MRVFVAPIVWLIVSFAQADYYVCAKVGPNPDNKTGLVSMAEKDMLEQMMETTKTESQFIAWGLSVGMVLVIFLVICLCGGKFKFIQHLCSVCPSRLLRLRKGWPKSRQQDRTRQYGRKRHVGTDDGNDKNRVAVYRLGFVRRDGFGDLPSDMPMRW